MRRTGSPTVVPASVRAPSLRLSVLLVLNALLSGCAAQGPTPSPAERRLLPTWCTSGPCIGTPADVPRSGLLTEQGLCVWLEIDGVRSSVLWPKGFTAIDNPLRVFDSDGSLVAQADHEFKAVIVGPEPIPASACGDVRQVRVYL
jgi:hypothetical protein